MKNWVTSISVIAVVIALSEFILPHGKTQKTVRCVFGFCCLLVICAPIQKLANLSRGDYLINADKEYVYQQPFLDYINKEYCAAAEEKCRQVLSENGANFRGISVTTDSDAKVIRKITVYDLSDMTESAAINLICAAISCKEETIYFESST